MSHLLIALLFLNVSAAQDKPAAWNRFRGPNGCGIAAGAFPDKIGPEENVLWKRDVAPGHSSPILSKTRVFLTGLEDERLFTYAFERETGELAWKAECPRPRRTKFHAKNHPAAASPAVDGDTVVVFFDEFGVLAYDHDGKERWRLALGPFDNVYGMGASPILVGDAVVLACDQSTHSFVLAVSKKDGRELWRVERPLAVSGHSTPIVHRTAAGRDEVLLPGSFLLDAYDALTGKRTWWVSGLPGEMKSVPVLIDERLWIHGYASAINDHGQQIALPSFADAVASKDADHDGRIGPTELGDPRVAELFTYFDLVADGKLDESEWEMLKISLAAVNSALCIRVGGEGDRTDAAVIWREYRAIPQLPSPLVFGGIYWMLADQGGLLTLLDPDTGQTLAKERLTQAIDDYYAAPVGGDGKVYLLSESGTLSVLASGRELDPLYTARFEEPCYATPALEDRQIFLRTAEHLYCFAAGAAGEAATGK